MLAREAFREMLFPLSEKELHYRASLFWQAAFFEKFLEDNGF